MKGDYIVEEKIGLLEGKIARLEERIARLEWERRQNNEGRT
jgi:uncharacterized small protein (DUF1192 family)